MPWPQGLQGGPGGSLAAFQQPKVVQNRRESNSKGAENKTSPAAHVTSLSTLHGQTQHWNKIDAAEELTPYHNHCHQNGEVSRHHAWARCSH